MFITRCCFASHRRSSDGSGQPSFHASPCVADSWRISGIFSHTFINHYVHCRSHDSSRKEGGKRHLVGWHLSHDLCVCWNIEFLFYCSQICCFHVGLLSDSIAGPQIILVLWGYVSLKYVLFADWSLQTSVNFSKIWICSPWVPHHGCCLQYPVGPRKYSWCVCLSAFCLVFL